MLIVHPPHCIALDLWLTCDPLYKICWYIVALNMSQRNGCLTYLSFVVNKDIIFDSDLQIQFQLTLIYNMIIENPHYMQIVLTVVNKEITVSITASQHHNIPAWQQLHPSFRRSLLNFKKCICKPLLPHFLHTLSSGRAVPSSTPPTQPIIYGPSLSTDYHSVPYPPCTMPQSPRNIKLFRL